LQVDHVKEKREEGGQRPDKKRNCFGSGKIVRLVGEFDAGNAESIGLMKNAFT